MISSSLRHPLSQLTFVVGALALSAYSGGKTSVVERIVKKPQVLDADLLTSMPSDLFVFEKAIVWHSAIPDDDTHLVNRQTGDEVCVLKVQGEGPYEVATPDLQKSGNDSLVVYDLNSPRALHFSVSACLSGDTLPAEVTRQPEDLRGLTCLPIDAKHTLYATPAHSHPFLLVRGEERTPFGTFPLKLEEEITNGGDVFQGTISYNPNNRKLVYSNAQMAYMALYDWNGRHFHLAKEMRLAEVDYEITNRELHLDKVKQKAPTALTITKDYIVCISRDKESADKKIDAANYRGRRQNFARTPQQLFVYNLDMELQKIINLQIPVFRIASDATSNTVYLIGVNPDFCLLSCNI